MEKKKRGEGRVNLENNFIIIMGMCFLTAVVFLMLCSRSSFLYSYNNWDDANSYFTMGKFMMNGGIIYRDLYDQKGPYLYLLYGIAYLISNRSFLGVFILEILAITVFLYFGYKIFRLYCTPKMSLILIPVLAACTLSSLSFYWGGAAEEFCLPLMMSSLFMSLSYWKRNYPKEPTDKMILINGVFAGIIMQVKYTLLGFYFAWMAMIVLMMLVQKKWKNALKSSFIFLSGMFITMIPWLVYFGIHNALDDWYQCYIYNNIFFYSDLQENSSGLGMKLYDLAKILYNLILDNFSYFIFIIIGCYYMVFSRRNNWYEKVNVIALFGLCFLGIYIGGANIFYYSIPLMIFSVIGLAAIGRGILRLEQKWEISLKGKKTFGLVAILMFFLCLYTAEMKTMNREYRELKKEEHFLYQFNEIVEQEENPTLLNVNMLDAGLYTVTGIVPTCKYFQTNGIALKEMEKEQRQYIREGRTQFVISRFIYPEGIEKKYDLIVEAKFPTDGKNETSYYLFKRKE